MTEPALNPLARALKNDAANNNRPPPVLLIYQQKWVADDAQLKIGEKSRRIGLTWAEASDDVLIAAKEGGSNVFYIGPTQDMALEFIEACAMWARVYNYAASEIEEGIFLDGEGDGAKEIKTYKIDFPATGKRIVALSSRPTNLRGKQGVIVIDEAAFHPDLKGLLKAAMAMLMWGDRVRIISTHDGVDNAFNELIQEIRALRRKGSVHRYTFNDAVAQGLYKRVCLRRGIAWTAEGEAEWVKDVYSYYADDAAEELDVVPSQSGGAFLPMSLIEARMSPETSVIRKRWAHEFALLPEATRTAEVDAWCREELLPILLTFSGEFRYALGEDFGRFADLTVLAIGEELKNLTTRVRLIVELSNCPFEQQKQILFYILDRLPRFRSGALDKTGNGAYLSEVTAQKYGATRIEQIDLSQQFYLDHMPRFKAAMQDGTFEAIPRDTQIRDDLRALRIIDGVPKLPKVKTQTADGVKLQRHGDAAIALFLLHYAMKRDFVPIEFQSLEQPRLGARLNDYLE